MTAVNPNHRMPTDAEMAALRDGGALVCHCTTPRPVQLGFWNERQCVTCGRLITERLDEDGERWV